MHNKLNSANMYRLPWNLVDNAISWLEPTSKCNLYCDGCYRENRAGSHKPLDEINRELDLFQRLRKTDSISIAGGEPLSHPQIVDIVSMIRRRGWKPVINSNGALLSDDLLLRLKDAGIEGFTLHIDSGQNRPGWKGKNELELNELRLHYAEMLARAGDLSCSFNATVYPENLHYMPQLLKWSQEHIDIVHVMVFIIYRMAILGKGYDFYSGSQKVDFDDMMYSKADDNRRTDVSSQEVVDIIRQLYPDFQPAAFLNGTEKPESFKWLLTGRFGNKHEIFGYATPWFLELIQTVKHLFTDSYLAYSNPKWLRRGRLILLLSLLDKGLGHIVKNYFRSATNNPKAFYSRIHYQSVLIIQPVDVYPNGQVNMCDGCPDITVWNDQLVWSCRMEEQYRWGQNVRVVPKESEV